MAIPTSKASFKTWCLQQLGYPTIQIEVTEEQVDNRVDFALRKFADFHFEGSERLYYKYQITPNNYSMSIYGLTVANGGNGYNNTDILVFSGGGGIAANGTLTTNATGGIVAVDFQDNGGNFALAPTVNVVNSTGGASLGTGASVTAELGGFIPLPENIIGIIELWPVGAQASPTNLFSLRYQIVLNDLYMFNNLNIVPYVTTMYNVAQIEEVLVGQQPIRYNRYKNRAILDMDWSLVTVGDWIVMTAYGVIDPDTYSKVWSDPWLQQYATAQIKLQWGSALKKYGNMALVGGMVFNGKEIYDEARQEILELEQELRDSWQPVPTNFMA